MPLAGLAQLPNGGGTCRVLVAIAASTDAAPTWRQWRMAADLAASRSSRWMSELHSAEAPTQCLRTLGYDLSFRGMGLASSSGSDEKHPLPSCIPRRRPRPAPGLGARSELPEDGPCLHVGLRREALPIERERLGQVLPIHLSAHRAA